MPKKKKAEPKPKPHPCRKCGEITRQAVFCGECHKRFQAWLFDTADRLFWLQVANQEPRKQTAST
jgi:hypothetical protein